MHELGPICTQKKREGSNQPRQIGIVQTRAVNSCSTAVTAREAEQGHKTDPGQVLAAGG